MNNVHQEIARVAEAVADQFQTEGRHCRDVDDLDSAIVKEELAAGFRYFAELIQTADIDQH